MSGRGSDTVVIGYLGLSSVYTNLSSKLPRTASSAVRILDESDPMMVGKFGIGRSEIVLRCRLSSDSSILSIQTIEKGPSLSKSLIFYLPAGDHLGPGRLIVGQSRCRDRCSWCEQ